MSVAAVTEQEFPNLVTLFADRFAGSRFSAFLHLFENIIFSSIIILTILWITYFATRKKRVLPSGLQNAAELFIEGIDDFVCGILGAKGRRYTPFIGTLFIYILLMNLSGLIPFFKSATSSWSTTLALALCVFFYVQYSALKELGFLGYLDHLMGRPRGALASSVLIPLLMLFLHIISELVRPLSLSLRLRSNIWGEDLLLSFLAGFGIKGIVLLVFNSLLVLIAAMVQAVVFCLLTTIYFALVLVHEEE